jgi:hypothetical protein
VSSVTRVAHQGARPDRGAAPTRSACDAADPLTSVGSDNRQDPDHPTPRGHLERRATRPSGHFFVSPTPLFSSSIRRRDADAYRDEVMRRTGHCRPGGGGGVTMLHENEKEIFGDIRAAWGLVTKPWTPRIPRSSTPPIRPVRRPPVDEALPEVRPYTDYIHIRTRRPPTPRWCRRRGTVRCGSTSARARRRLRRFVPSSPTSADSRVGGLCGPDLWTTATSTDGI